MNFEFAVSSGVLRRAPRAAQGRDRTLGRLPEETIAPEALAELLARLEGWRWPRQLADRFDSTRSRQ